MSQSSSSSSEERPCKRSKAEEASFGNMDDDNAKVALQRRQDLQLALFECPVCFHYALPPIYQCKVGHVLCSSCSPQLKDCPSCNEPLDGSRNWAMEKVAETIDFPCQNADYGCVAILPFLEKQQHEENCKYRPCPCPFLWKQCQWSGTLDEVLIHMDNCFGRNLHFPTNIAAQMTHHFKILRRPTENNYWIRFQYHLGERFLLFFLRTKRNGEFFYYAFVTLFGAPRKANIFNYKLKISQGRNSLSWGSTSRSIYESYETTIQRSKCLTLDVSTANELADENGKLSIEVIISKNTETQ